MDFLGFYSKKVLDHVKHPRNLGEMEDPDSSATVGNKRCGDIMKIYIKVGKKNREGHRAEYLKDVKFQTLGCGAAIATSSMITTMVKGKFLTDAEKVTNQAVAEALGGLPATKMHCSVLAADALKKAIENYRRKK